MVYVYALDPDVDLEMIGLEVGPDATIRVWVPLPPTEFSVVYNQRACALEATKNGDGGLSVYSDANLQHMKNLLVLYNKKQFADAEEYHQENLAGNANRTQVIGYDTLTRWYQIDGDNLIYVRSGSPTDRHVFPYSTQLRYALCQQLGQMEHQVAIGQEGLKELYLGVRRAGLIIPRKLLGVYLFGQIKPNHDSIVANLPASDQLVETRDGGAIHGLDAPGGLDPFAVADARARLNYAEATNNNSQSTLLFAQMLNKKDERAEAAEANAKAAEAKAKAELAEERARTEQLKKEASAKREAEFAKAASSLAAAAADTKAAAADTKAATADTKAATAHAKETSKTNQSTATKLHHAMTPHKPTADVDQNTGMYETPLNKVSIARNSLSPGKIQLFPDNENVQDNKGLFLASLVPILTKFIREQHSVPLPKRSISESAQIEALEGIIKNFCGGLLCQYYRSDSGAELISHDDYTDAEAAGVLARKIVLPGSAQEVLEPEDISNHLKSCNYKYAEANQIDNYETLVLPDVLTLMPGSSTGSAALKDAVGMMLNPVGFPAFVYTVVAYFDGRRNDGCPAAFLAGGGENIPEPPDHDKDDWIRNNFSVAGQDALEDFNGAILTKSLGYCVDIGVHLTLKTNNPLDRNEKLTVAMTVHAKNENSAAYPLEEAMLSMTDRNDIYCCKISSSASKGRARSIPFEMHAFLGVVANEQIPVVEFEHCILEDLPLRWLRTAQKELVVLKGCPLANDGLDLFCASYGFEGTQKSPLPIHFSSINDKSAPIWDNVVRGIEKKIIGQVSIADYTSATLEPALSGITKVFLALGGKMKFSQISFDSDAFLDGNLRTHLHNALLRDNIKRAARQAAAFANDSTYLKKVSLKANETGSAGSKTTMEVAAGQQVLPVLPMKKHNKAGGLKTTGLDDSPTKSGSGGSGMVELGMGNKTSPTSTTAARGDAPKVEAEKDDIVPTKDKVAEFDFFAEFDDQRTKDFLSLLNESPKHDTLKAVVAAQENIEFSTILNMPIVGATKNYIQLYLTDTTGAYWRRIVHINFPKLCANYSEIWRAVLDKANPSLLPANSSRSNGIFAMVKVETVVDGQSDDDVATEETTKSTGGKAKSAAKSPVLHGGKSVVKSGPKAEFDLSAKFDESDKQQNRKFVELINNGSWPVMNNMLKAVAADGFNIDITDEGLLQGSTGEVLGVGINYDGTGCIEYQFCGVEGEEKPPFIITFDQSFRTYRDVECAVQNYYDLAMTGARAKTMGPGDDDIPGLEAASSSMSSGTVESGLGATGSGTKPGAPLSGEKVPVEAHAFHFREVVDGQWQWHQDFLNSLNSQPDLMRKLKIVAFFEVPGTPQEFKVTGGDDNGIDLSVVCDQADYSVRVKFDRTCETRDDVNVALQELCNRYRQKFDAMQVARARNTAMAPRGDDAKTEAKDDENPPKTIPALLSSSESAKMESKEEEAKDIESPPKTTPALGSSSASAKKESKKEEEAKSGEAELEPAPALGKFVADKATVVEPPKKGEWPLQRIDGWPFIVIQETPIKVPATKASKKKGPLKPCSACQRNLAKNGHYCRMNHDD